MFKLHKQLEADTLLVGDLALNRVLLMNDRQFPWLILVPKIANATELYHLDEAQTQRFWQESRLVSEVLVDYFNAEKLNVAALGNMVPQLHVHHVVRFRHDLAWPGPIWGKFPALPYADEQINILLKALKKLLKIKDS
jgi:diadenosine tetraphosphate (Ap4A) HIT family hydrolase